MIRLKWASAMDDARRMMTWLQVDGLTSNTTRSSVILRFLVLPPGPIVMAFVVDMATWLSTNSIAGNLKAHCIPLH